MRASASDLTATDLDRMVGYWEAANYLTVAQIYLQENVLLREPLRPEHIKPRLLGHWGTSLALNLVYVQLNRLIRRTARDVLYIAGPGHGSQRSRGQRLPRSLLLGALPTHIRG